MQSGEENDNPQRDPKATGTEARLQALVQELAELRRQQAALIDRQTRLESQWTELQARQPLSMPAVPGPRPAQPPPLPVILQQHVPSGHPRLPDPSISSPAQNEPKRHPDLAPPAPQLELETKVGANWINRIAVVTLICGAGFLFKYGIDNNWIGPAARVLLGILAGAIALGSGEWIQKRGLRIFAQGITGLGLALLYLSCWAASELYGLVPDLVSFPAMCLVTAGGGLLAMRHRAESVAGLGLVGGYLTPVLLSASLNRPWFLFSYLLVLNFGALWVIRGRGWTRIEAIAVNATGLYFLGIATDSSDTFTERLVNTLFGAAFYAQFWFGHRFVWAIAQFLYPIAVVLCWTQQPGGIASLLPFVLGGLAFAELRETASGTGRLGAARFAPVWTLLTTALAVLLYLGISTWEAPVLMATLLGAVFLIFLAWVPWRVKIRSASDTSSIDAADLLVFGGCGPLYFAAAYPLLETVSVEPRGVLALAIGGIYLALARWLGSGSGPNSVNGDAASRAADPPAWEQLADPACLALGLACGFLTLAIPIQFSEFRITVAWAFEAAILAWIGTRTARPILHGMAWLVLVLAVLRILQSDAWIYSGGERYALLLNARFLTLACAAASLWLCARFWIDAAIGSLQKSVPADWLQPSALLAYLAGHAVLLLALALETIGWADRSFTTAVASITSIALSIMITVYGAAAIFIGVQTRQRVHRLVGLFLIGAVILKLYFYDVWILSRLFRILAFLALGAILLVVSYLYSRYRHVLDRLLEDDAHGPKNPGAPPESGSGEMESAT